MRNSLAVRCRFIAAVVVKIGCWDVTPWRVEIHRRFRQLFHCVFMLVTAFFPPK